MSIFNWPKKKPDEADGQADSHPVRAEILVCEDDREEMEFICGLLRFQDAIVTRAYSIAEAVEAISGPIRFQLAFVDLNLKDGSGVAVVRRIKQSKRGTHPVVVSAHLDRIMLCLDEGYTGVLMKPYTIDSIRRVLRAHRLPTSD